MWALKTSKRALAAAVTAVFFFPPEFLKMEARKKGKFQCHQVACECALCGMAQQPGKLLLLSITPALCST